MTAKKPAVVLPANVKKFIKEITKAFPKAMRRVVCMKFGDLGTYVDLTTEDDKQVQGVAIPKCGCLVGSVAIALFESQPNCAVKGVDKELASLVFPISNSKRVDAFNAASTPALLHAMIEACAPAAKSAKLAEQFNEERLCEIGGAVPLIADSIDDESFTFVEYEERQEMTVKALKAEIKVQLAKIKPAAKKPTKKVA